MRSPIPFGYLLPEWWATFVHHGLPLAILLVVGLLVPRLGRYAITIFTNRQDDQAQESKARLALFGAFVYIVQMVVYFLLIVAALKTLGFSLVGAAIPATVISAAVGLGAQSIIADFLAGFFVLQEKQFGVGDWVRFQGPGIDVEGDVIQMTMRSTKIRTLAGETVIVPNSAARVCINHSNYWARAVAVVPVPLLGSATIHEAIDRCERAALKALDRDDIAPDVRGGLDVHPAVAIEKPTVVGMPWLADMRFVVQVNPARQWAVERAIRTAVLEEFWAEYGSATTTSGALRQDLITAEDAAEMHAALALAQHDAHLSDEATTDPTRQMPATGSGSGRERLLSRPETGRSDVSVADPTPTSPANGQANADVAGDVHSDHRATPTASDTNTREKNKPLDSYGPIRRALSLGGRIRPSTTALILTLFALLVLRGLTLDTGDGHPNGVWAPPAVTDTSEDDEPTTDPTASHAPAPTEVAEHHSNAPQPTPNSASSTPAPAPADTDQDQGEDRDTTGEDNQQTPPPAGNDGTQPGDNPAPAPGAEPNPDGAAQPSPAPNAPAENPAPAPAPAPAPQNPPAPAPGTADTAG